MKTPKSSFNVTSTRMQSVGFASAKFEQFVAKQKSAMMRRARRSGDTLTDEQADKDARAICGMYSHHFRVWVPSDSQLTQE